MDSITRSSYEYSQLVDGSESPEDPWTLVGETLDLDSNVLVMHKPLDR